MLSLLAKRQCRQRKFANKKYINHSPLLQTRFYSNSMKNIRNDDKKEKQHSKSHYDGDGQWFDGERFDFWFNIWKGGFIVTLLWGWIFRKSPLMGRDLSWPTFLILVIFWPFFHILLVAQEIIKLKHCEKRLILK